MPKIEVTCKQCGKEFEVLQYRKHTALFCSRTCKNAFRPNVQKTCANCGKLYYVHNHRKEKSKFCCVDCYKTHVNSKITLNCKHCGKQFQRQKSECSNNKGTFCSKECYYKYRNKYYINENHPRYIESFATCRYCGKIFHIQPNQKNEEKGNFCSTVCQNMWRSENIKGENHPNWMGGISYEPYCQLFNNEFKERVRDFFGRKCVECGKPENGRRLSVHHVVYDKEACCNDGDAVENRLFVPLCVSCHTKTNKNRDLWQERFTKLINEEYNGQCYLPKGKV